MSQATAPKISILGDGISTFEGYTPRVGSFYSPSYASYSGFNTAEGTWWMQAIEQLGDGSCVTIPLPALMSATRATIPPRCRVVSAPWPPRRRNPM